MKNNHFVLPLVLILSFGVGGACASTQKRGDPFQKVKQEAGEASREVDQSVEQRKGQPLQKKN